MAITKGTPASNATYGSSYNLSVTCSGTNRCLLVGLVWEGNAPLFSLKYNGVDLTAISGATSTSGNRNAKLYQLVAPATGANTLALVWDGGSNDYALMALPLKGVDQTMPASNGTGATNTTSPITVAVTSATGSLVVDAFWLAHSGGGGTTTVDASQTADVDRENYDGVHSAGMSSEAGAASVTMSWAATVITRWVQAAASINAAAAGPSGKPANYYAQL